MDYSLIWQNKILLSCADDESVEKDPPVEKNDQQLIKLILDGDEAAFDQIFERYKRLVANIAARYFQNPDQIEEIIQISFSKAFLELNKFRGSYDFSLARWLGQIARNACLDALRKQKRKPENLFCEFPAENIETLFSHSSQTTKTPESILIERDLAEKLLARLEPEDRLILQMWYEEELNIKQIAEATGWSNVKVRVKVHRARKSLKKILKRFI